MHARVAAAAVVCAVAAPASAAPQDAPKSIRAVRVGPPPTLDGVLDEPAWRDVPFVADFAQAQPFEGAAPSRRTEVGFAYDDHALYVGARMFADGPDDIEAVMTRRDESGNAERIIVSLDTFGDRRTAYSFAVTAAGVRVDWFHPDDDAFSRVSSFDPVWQAETRVGAEGWTAEMRIPFSQLRFASGASQAWGVNINRYMPQDNEDVFWIVVPKNETGWSSYFGALTGIESIAPSRRLEIVPYVASDLTWLGDARLDPDDPFAEQLDLTARAGADFKLGLGPSLTLDAALNPDFGQVEADPAVVNLSAFETTFGERRPFFTEGAQLLSGIGPRYFYSRRVGASPRGDPAADPVTDGDGDGDDDIDYASLPASTRILSAAKITGRPSAGLSVGALAALTQAADADVALGDLRRSVRVEPYTSYGVLRLERELGRDASLVGLSLTGLHRFMDTDAALARQLARWAYAGGLDARWRSPGASWELSGYLGGSAVGGEPEAIEALQRSSAHYFQRPDQDHVELDPTRELITGWTASLAAARRKGAWIGSARLGAESPGFAINDAGQLFSADDLSIESSLRYRDNQPHGPLHEWNLGGYTNQAFNFGFVRQPASALLDGGVTWSGSLWRTTAFAEYLAAGDSDDLTRGGPLMELGPGWGVGASQLTGFGGRNPWNVGTSYTSRAVGQSGLELFGGATWLPADRLALKIGPRFSRLRDTRQYLDTLERGPGGAEQTFGQRYVFGTVERRELALELRINVALSPTLSLETFVQPFASSGRFSELGELAGAGGRDLRRYGDDGTTIVRGDDGYTVTDGTDAFALDDPDFTVLSLRSTAVLRWELAPGSALFVVWQQDRGDVLDVAAGIGLDRLGDAATAAGRQTLALKLSYWWGAM